MVHRPAWVRDGQVFVSFAETVGINKDGNALYEVDRATGRRTDTVDDRVEADVTSLLAGQDASTGRWVANEAFSAAIPVYYDDRQTAALAQLLSLDEFQGLTSRTIGSLVAEQALITRPGHGSPSADLRDGEVPYIKVADIRAGQININPTNMVPRVVAEKFWKGSASGVHPFDLVTPMRASKNIGEFAMVMPGQENVVFTKEVLLVRPGESSIADNFYLMWALSLRAVRDQWRRIVFMQTNREDVGNRYLEIEIPWPDNEIAGQAVSAAFREYYLGLERARNKFLRALERSGNHYVFLGSLKKD